MPQISLYIDEKTLREIEIAAKHQKTSISKWVVEKIRRSIKPAYPDGYEGLFGSIDDNTFSEPSELAFSTDGKREPL